MRRAFWRTLAGTRLSWRAWKPAHPSRSACAEVNLRRVLAREALSWEEAEGGRVEEAGGEEESWDAVCWQMGLCEGQWFFWQSCEQYWVVICGGCW